MFGGGEWFFKTLIGFNAISTSLQRYVNLIGFCNAAGNNQQDGIFFMYDEGGVATGSSASPNWKAVTANNNFRTFVDTGIPVTATFQELIIIVNAAATSVDYYVDGVLGATVTTTIPGAGRTSTWTAQTIKATGTTATLTNVDYIDVQCEFTTSR
jgi:hypothetical protein